MNEQFKQAIEQCRAIARFEGRVDNGIGYAKITGGSAKERGVWYEDVNMCIWIGAETQRMAVDCRITNNPVVGIAADGSIIRAHGDFSLLYDHIRETYENNPKRRELEQVKRALMLEQENARLVQLIREIKVQLELIPDHDINPSNSRYVIETVNYAYALVLEALENGTVQS